MTVADILKEKGSTVYSIDSESSVMQAVKEMNRLRIGALLVTRDDRTLGGIVTERDVMIHLPAGIRNKKVRDIMTPREKLIIANGGDTLDYAMSAFTEKRVRHLPVLDGDRLVGLVSIGDIVKAQLKDADFENKALRDYILGSYPIVS
jgi:CBS domain-containing protein